MDYDSNWGPKWTPQWIGNKPLIYSKSIIGDDINCELVEWTLENLGLSGAFHLPTHHQPRLKDKREQVMCVQASIEIVFIKVKKQDT